MAVERPGQRVADALAVLESWAAASSANPPSEAETPSEREAPWLVRQSAFHRLKRVRAVPMRVHPSFVLSSRSKII
jgi:hypothetical protein